MMDFYRHQLLQNASLECKIRISVILMDPRVAHFKIGKTVDNEIKLIYETEDKALVDELEKVLIRDYMMMYPTRCDNKQEGAGPDCADSDKPTAKIYVVVKYKD